MININFYPWREERNQNQKKFLKKTIILFICLLIASGFSMHFILLQRQEIMEKELNDMNEELKNMKLANEKNPHDENYSSLSLVKSLAEFMALRQKAACFTHFSRTNRSLVFEGKARSANEFTQFILQWNNEKKFSEIQIKSMNQDKTGMIHFQLEAIPTDG